MLRADLQHRSLAHCPAQPNLQRCLLVSRHQPALHHPRKQSVVPRALPDGISPVAIGLATVALPAAGLAGWKFSLYSQLEVVTAKMIGNFVPKGARNVLQLGGSTRELFYLPKSTGQVTVVGEDVTPSLFDQAGLNAQMPCRARKQPPTNLGFIPDASLDAVVSVGGLARLGQASQREQAFNEVLRVLKPGAPLILIEPISDGASPLRGLIGSVPKGAQPVAASELEDLLDCSALDVVQVDVALDGTDPHAVGLARRTAAAVAAAGKGSKEPKRVGARREWKAASKAGEGKGFSSGKDAGSQ